MQACLEVCNCNSTVICDEVCLKQILTYTSPETSGELCSRCLDPVHTFPHVVGSVCHPVLRLSGKVFFSFFLLVLTVHLTADQVNTRCGSLVWNFVLIIPCHRVKIKSHSSSCFQLNVMKKRYMYCIYRCSCVWD